MALLFHYYGDTVRKLFLAAAIIMLLTLPFYNDRLPVPVVLSIFAIVILGSFAGFISPANKWVGVLNIAISVVGLGAFEFFAVTVYRSTSFSDALFIIDQVLAILFLFALYYSSKTLRGTFLRS